MGTLGTMSNSFTISGISPRSRSNASRGNSRRASVRMAADSIYATGSPASYKTIPVPMPNSNTQYQELKLVDASSSSNSPLLFPATGTSGAVVIGDYMSLGELERKMNNLNGAVTPDPYSRKGLKVKGESDGMILGSAYDAVESKMETLDMEEKVSNSSESLDGQSANPVMQDQYNRKGLKVKGESDGMILGSAYDDVESKLKTMEIE